MLSTQAKHTDLEDKMHGGERQRTNIYIRTTKNQ